MGAYFATKADLMEKKHTEKKEHSAIKAQKKQEMKELSEKIKKEKELKKAALKAYSKELEEQFAPAQENLSKSPNQEKIVSPV